MIVLLLDLGNLDLSFISSVVGDFSLRFGKINVNNNFTNNYFYGSKVGWFESLRITLITDEMIGFNVIFIPNKQ